VFYGASTQTAHIVIDYNIWAHKTKRSDLVLSSAIASSLRQIHITLCLGSEKRMLGETEASTRLLEVRKGIKKLGKWLSGAEIKSMTVSWQEPPQTYSWEMKREVLDGLRGLKAERVVEGEINWGLEGKGKWNRGKKYRFEAGYLGSLERGGNASQN
jgi:hypothetical protein